MIACLLFYVCGLYWTGLPGPVPARFNRAAPSVIRRDYLYIKEYSSEIHRSPLKIPARRLALVGLFQPQAQFIVSYLKNGSKNFMGDTCQDFPAEAKLAFNYAADLWGSLLVSPIPIKIEACWADLPSGTLGYSSVLEVYKNFAGAPLANVYYSAPLANALTRTDRNGTQAEITIAYNANLLDSFYFGTDLATPSDRFNFSTIVLHEIAHGLGLNSQFTVDWIIGSWDWDAPTIYDSFVVDSRSRNLINTDIFSTVSPELGAALMSNNLSFNGPSARLANGGSAVRLYAPSKWSEGSSVAHLDERYNNTLDSLMTFSLGQGETIYDPGPVVMGILRDLGWETTYAEPPRQMFLMLIQR